MVARNNTIGNCLPSWQLTKVKADSGVVTSLQHEHRRRYRGAHKSTIIADVNRIDLDWKAIQKIGCLHSSLGKEIPLSYHALYHNTSSFLNSFILRKDGAYIQEEFLLRTGSGERSYVSCSISCFSL